MMWHVVASFGEGEGGLGEKLKNRNIAASFGEEWVGGFVGETEK